MWDPLLNNTYKNYMKKRVFIKLKKNFMLYKVLHGILKNISKINADGIYTLTLSYNTNYTHMICSDIIDNIWYDNSLNTYFNYKLLKPYFVKNTNNDITNYEIKKFIKKDFIYI